METGGIAMFRSTRPRFVSTLSILVRSSGIAAALAGQACVASSSPTDIEHIDQSSNPLLVGPPIDPSPGTMGPVSELTNGDFFIRGLAGKCLAADKAFNVVLMPCNEKTLDQRVRVVERPGDRVVELKIDGRCIQPRYGFFVEGVSLETATCTGAPGQHWMLDGDSIRLAGDPSWGSYPDRVMAVLTHSGASAGAIGIVQQRLDDSDYWEVTPYPETTMRPTSGFVTASTKEQLLAAIARTNAEGARPGEVIEIPPDATIDLSDQHDLVLRPRVTLRSGRTGFGRRDHDRRGLITFAPKLENQDTIVLFAMNCEGARVTGLTLSGPTIGRDHDTPLAIGIAMHSVVRFDTKEVPNCFVDPPLSPSSTQTTTRLRMTVDHDDLFGWQLGAVNSWAPTEFTSEEGRNAVCRSDSSATYGPAVIIARNYIHENRRDGTGYAVSVGGDGEATIFGNVFFDNRHAIAGTGEAGMRYDAALNLVLWKAPVQHYFTGEWDHPDQDFDIHGTEDGPCGQWRGGAGGEQVKIRFNTFMGADRNNLSIRGTACDHTYFEDNVTRQDESAIFDYNQSIKIDVPVYVPGTSSFPPHCESLSASDAHVVLHRNRFAIRDPARFLGTGDFDGDGTDDVLFLTGAAWFVSFGGRTPWQFRADGADKLSDLRFGDLDGDGRTDVIRSSTVTSELLVRFGAEGDWRTLRKEAIPIDDVLVGNFDGVGGDDLLLTDGATWRVASGGIAPWTTLSSSSLRAPALRVGRFDADPRSDVLAVYATGRWGFRSGGNGPVVDLGPALETVTNAMSLVDVDGNGVSDVVISRLVTSGGDFYQLTNASYGGTTAWVLIAQGETARLGPLGRFDALPGADALFWNGNRTWDLASSTGTTTGLGARALFNANEMF
jgi:hypothetical protein